jgi:hypothetical protein
MFHASFRWCKTASRAVRCNRIRLDAREAGPTSPVFFFALFLYRERLGSGRLQDRNQISGSRNTFVSSSEAVNPSGKVPRLYSAMRFFHFKKSVML